MLLLSLFEQFHLFSHPLYVIHSDKINCNSNNETRHTHSQLLNYHKIKAINIFARFSSKGKLTNCDKNKTKRNETEYRTMAWYCCLNCKSTHTITQAATHTTMELHTGWFIKRTTYKTLLSVVKCIEVLARFVFIHFFMFSFLNFSFALDLFVRTLVLSSHTLQLV